MGKPLFRSSVFESASKYLCEYERTRSFENVENGGNSGERYGVFDPPGNETGEMDGPY